MSAPAPELSLLAPPLSAALAAHPDTDVLAVPVRPALQADDDDVALRPGAGAEDLAALAGADLPAVLALAKAQGKAGEITAVPVRLGERHAELLLVGVGDQAPSSLRRAGAAVARKARGRARLVSTVVQTDDDKNVRAFAEGLVLGAYRPRRDSGGGPAALAAAVLLVEQSQARAEALRRAVVGSTATVLARDLANTPSLVKSPQWLAEQVATIGAEHGLSVKVRDEHALKDEGFGGLLAVGSGSQRPPRLVEVGYRPKGRGPVPHVVLVGKGITFDSGGLSLKKPWSSMAPMKADMAGAAAVFGVLTAVAELGLPVRVTGLLALAENLPSGSAYRPGDVVTQYGGRTVEIRNTDAEGRIVLADALAYADATLAPDVLVDVATLTGAATLALGRGISALFATDDILAGELVAAAETSGEPTWRMPLVEDYRFALDSDIADICHVATDSHVSGGAITAALFLREFTGGRAWAHLDIAGPGKVEKDEHEVTKGGTGYGVRLLLRWLEALGEGAALRRASR